MTGSGREKASQSPKATKLDFITIEEAAERLAPVCLAIAEQYPLARGILRSHLKVTLKWLIRDAERYVQSKVSLGAQKRAEEMDLPDLRTMRWRDQPTRMRDPGRKIFHHEHVTRVADMADDILALNSPNLQQIEQIIRGIVVAWILKEEDRLLPPGYRADPNATYKVAGVDLQDE